MQLQVTNLYTRATRAGRSQLTASDTGTICKERKIHLSTR